MAAAVGFVEEFQPGPNSSWEQYAERLNFYFIANGVEDPEKKRAVLLSVCGKTTYALLRSIVMPQALSDLSFKDIVKKVGEHFTPKPSEIVQRFKFNKRCQLRSESISDYVADLRRLSEHCGFGETLDLMLRDRLVCGMCDESVQRRLLSEPELSFKKALDISIASETANRNAEALRTTPNSYPEQGDVHGVWNSAKQKTSQSNNRNKKQKNKQPAKQPPGNPKPCFRCGEDHSPTSCRFIGTVCDYCSKKGHIARVCLSKARDKKAKNKQPETTAGATHSVEKDTCFLTHFSDAYVLNQINGITSNANFTLTVLMNGVSHTMEVDSGAACSIISEKTFREIWPKTSPKLETGTISLRTWTQEKLRVLGTITTDIQYRNEQYTLPLIVIEGSGVSLLGRNWFSALGIQFSGIQSITPFESSTSQVFADGLGTYTGPPVTVEVDPTVKPVFLKSRPVPFALRPKVEEELQRLVTEGVLEPVAHSEWATPIVPVLKKDGSIRICGDYRATVNTAIKRDTYSLPTTAELLASLAGGKRFSRLDMSDAYLQLPVDDATAQLLTLNTHRGLFKMKRLPFGISTAASIFQRVMDTMLAGVTGVGAYLDDVLISGDSDHTLHETETVVLSKISQTGLRLKRKKCVFNTDSVEFLGFRVDADGVHPTDDKVFAIHNAPAPTNKQELQAYLGLLNFYSCFLPNKATVLEPLHRLLDKEEQWIWTAVHKAAFEASKELLKSTAVLAHYDPDSPLVLACDASPYGVGAILSHVGPDRMEKPVAYASRTLTSTERNYGHIDKEALSIIFGVQKFHQYLCGRSFTIITDHKPLLGLFHPSRRMPQVLSPRMLRWSLLLSAYDYSLIYRQGKHHANVDALSRLPVSVPDWNITPPGDILLLESNIGVPLDASKIAQLTTKDPCLSRVLRWVLHGWPSEQPSPEFAPFFHRRNELSTHKNCILWGSRVVIPPVAREQVLDMLHEDHPGIVKMKALGRSYVWWPGLDKDVENKVAKCDECQLTRNSPSRNPHISWDWPENCWSRVHVDFAGPYQGQLFFLLVDAHSKWLEVRPVPSTSSQTVISLLRQLFATHGLPDTIVSDNGAAFTSKEYLDFLKSNGIRASHVAPYHPSSNGQVERYVQTTKQALKKLASGNWSEKLARFLLSQHTTPNATTGATPAELLMGRRLTTMLDRLHPDLVRDIREKQRTRETSGPPSRAFNVGDLVYAKSGPNGPKWVHAEVTECIGPMTYLVRTPNDKIWRRHVDQLRKRLHVDNKEDFDDSPILPDAVQADQSNENDPPDRGDRGETDDPPLTVAPDAQDLARPSPRRSVRFRKPPSHLSDFVVHHLGGKGCYVFSPITED